MLTEAVPIAMAAEVSTLKPNNTAVGMAAVGIPWLGEIKRGGG